MAAIIFKLLLVTLFSQNCHAAFTIALNSSGIWPGGIIPFRIDSNMSQANSYNVTIAMQMLETYSAGCIRFRPLNSSTANFIIIQDETNAQSQTCFSYTGRTGKWQPVRFAASCLASPGDALSLLMKVVGFYPENSRPDRDEYISMQWSNILPDKLAEFSTVQATVATYVHGNYDMGSLTHFTQSQYSVSPFGSTTPLKTWILAPGVPHPGIEVNTGFIGQRLGPSFVDMDALRLLYNCPYPTSPYNALDCSLGSNVQHGYPAGFMFCRCHVDKATGATYFTGAQCSTPQCIGCPITSNYQCQLVDASPGLARTNCTCQVGYTGTDCSQFYCSPPCTNGSLCIGPNQCLCPTQLLSPGLGGCVNPGGQVYCTPTCMNGGTCIIGGICRCQLGWTGPNCAQPICAIPCQNQGTCVAPNVCRCPLGYAGFQCETFLNDPITPCVNDTDCYEAFGDYNVVCLKHSPCLSVNNTCVCRPGYLWSLTGDAVVGHGQCLRARNLYDYCQPHSEICIKNAECINYRCQCNPIKGWVVGPLGDCVKATKKVQGGTCSYWDDCLYNLICSPSGSCICPTGMTVDENVTTNALCRPYRMFESCSVDTDCKFVGVNAQCFATDYVNTEGNTQQGGYQCQCRPGVPIYEFQVDSFHTATTCIPPYPKLWGERCSTDFSIEPALGPCEHGLVCQLCPRTTDEYRCAGPPPVLISDGTRLLSAFLSRITFVLLVIFAAIRFHAHE